MRGQIYPVPDPSLPFLGVHLSRTIDGDVLIGPTALLAPARDAYRLTTCGGTTSARRCAGPARRGWCAAGGGPALRELGARGEPPPARRARPPRYVPAIGAATTSSPGPPASARRRVGRDGALLDDFLLARTGRAVHVLNAPSPAATASLAIAEMIASEVA